MKFKYNCIHAGYFFQVLFEKCPIKQYNAIFDLFQLTDADQELYKNFPVVISERWQQEIAETVFDTINQEADKVEQKKKAKMKMKFDDEKGEVCFKGFLFSFYFCILFRLVTLSILTYAINNIKCPKACIGNVLFFKK